MKKHTVSVVINTLNEEKNLPRAISSIKNLADEIIVVDMKSSDKTVEIAKKFGAKVYEHKKTNYVEPARNYAISKATGDWILILDADEEVSSELAQLLKNLINSSKVDYYRLPRKNMIFGKWIENAMWWPDYNIRFFRNGCVSWSEIIHSVPTTVGKGSDVEAIEKYAIIHHHYDTIDQYLEKMLRYTSAQASDLLKKEYKFVWTDLLTKPANEFIRRFYQSSGYKDGMHGLALSLLQAFSEFIVYLKVWQSNEFTKKKLTLYEVGSLMNEIDKDKNYWDADARHKEYGGLVYRLKRKFKLR